MGKNNCWFTYVKRFFLPERKLKSEEKPRKGIWFFDMFEARKPAAVEAPHTTIMNKAPLVPALALDEVGPEEQRKHAMAVAIASTAAAEAAVASAKAASEVVRLTTISYEIARLNLASLKIQCAFRRHLAKRALSALKGVVKLQAAIRGRLLRKRVTEELASMKRNSSLLDYLNHIETKHNLRRLDERIKPIKVVCKSRSGWDQRIASEEGLEDFYIRKQEAVAKREQMKQYSYSQREMRNEQSLREENRKSRRFDQFLELKEVGHHHQHEEKERVKSLPHTRSHPLTHLKLRTARKQEIIEESDSPRSLPRRSSYYCHHAKHKSIGDDETLPNSPFFPAYMAPTESAKARVRSLSTPKQRLRLCDTSSSYSGQDSPYKHRHSTWNSFNGGEIIIDCATRNSISQQTYSGTSTR